ncbi:MAG: lipid-binding SYLF domain-containing protein [Opitutales bacterium]|jgi:lipid-binding SYLF domain-containing protein|nr:lipid-binding SYLF domain-containing protein [Opitutales bacterium]MBT5168608.1 lipid-binding SYLF domain-containing protein [Opitutales bacterium]MBT5814922.1 lipid-binding SYLF domain-containing protein [Opitutales bacterium]MBT6770664.1 lipid-binding SYLF domain-containing protein [Opitutales bacterium]MBT7864778.1 lipid-binding SYLF domain-containing protein [Opitutales bacterium]
MNHIFRTITLALSLAIGLGAIAAPKRSQLVNRIVNSEYALEEIMAKNETRIPASILQQAKGIILTVNYKGGFIIGGHAGRGVLVVKNSMTGKWGVPAFVSTGGANLGLQIGVKELDTVYVIMDENTVRKAYSGRFDLSADAAAVAGPVGILTEANESDDYKNANILVYTRTKGLFAGVSVKAGWVKPDNVANKSFYNTQYNAPEIVSSDWFEPPVEAKSLINRLRNYTKGDY